MGIEMGMETGRICTYQSLSPIEKIGYYPYSYPIKAWITHQNQDRFKQYPQRQIHLSSLMLTLTPIDKIYGKSNPYKVCPVFNLQIGFCMIKLDPKLKF